MIGRVGDGSLHRHWTAGSERPRSFDLHLSYYGDAAAPFADRHADITLTHEKEAKFPGLAACLDKIDQRLGAYEWICFVDDDIWADQAIWDRYFEIVDTLRPKLSQPALHRRSFYTYDLLLQRPRYIARWTNFVEIMNFCFHADLLKELRPTFSQSVSGWGLDHVWAKHAAHDERAFAVIDAAPVLHTRAVARGGLYNVLAGGAAGALAEGAALSQGNEVIPRAYAGVLVNGTTTQSADINTPLLAPRLLHKWRKRNGVNIIPPPPLA